MNGNGDHLKRLIGALGGFVELILVQVPPTNCRARLAEVPKAREVAELILPREITSLECRRFREIRMQRLADIAGDRDVAWRRCSLLFICISIMPVRATLLKHLMPATGGNSARDQQRS